MVLVFLPALDGIRPQWREAATNLGGSTWEPVQRFCEEAELPCFFPNVEAPTGHDADFYSSTGSHERTVAALALMVRELKRQKIGTVLPV